MCDLFYSDFHADLVKTNKTLLSLGSTLTILDKILKKEVKGMLLNCLIEGMGVAFLISASTTL